MLEFSLNLLNYTLDRYSPVLVSILITSPVFTNKGTLTVAPVSTEPGFKGDTATGASKPATVETKVVEKFSATPVSVFFNINKSKIASRKDLVNVKEMAEYAKANNKKIVVTGYADSKTGSSSFNQQLSEKRAKAVADELVKMGVSRDNIVIEAKGGVNDLSPFSYNRRVLVKLQ